MKETKIESMLTINSARNKLIMAFVCNTLYVWNMQCCCLSDNSISKSEKERHNERMKELEEEKERIEKKARERKKCDEEELNKINEEIKENKKYSEE